MAIIDAVSNTVFPKYPFPGFWLIIHSTKDEDVYYAYKFRTSLYNID